MAGNSREPQELVVKVVLTGLPESGKAVVLRHIAHRRAHDSISAGEFAGGAVHATEFYWPEQLTDGRRLRVRLFALSGRPAYNAVHELLVADCDGLVFVADVRPERLAEAQEAFRGTAFNVGRSGRDLKTIPLVLQYHHRGVAPEFDLDKMDRWLGVEPGSVERLTACYPREEDDLCAGVEQVVKRIAREACPEQEIMVS